MICNDDVSAHPRMNLTKNFYQTGRNQGFSAGPSGIHPDIELRLVAQEKCMCGMEDRVRIFEHNELPDACRRYMGN